VGLSFVGVNSREERQAVEEAITKYGENWSSAWLRTRGLEDWADYLDEQLVWEGGLK
jgi:hypothetical protein